MRRKRNVWNLLKGLLVPCVAGAVLLWFAAALDGLQDGQEAEDIRQLEEALRRGCGLLCSGGDLSAQFGVFKRLLRHTGE